MHALHCLLIEADVREWNAPVEVSALTPEELDELEAEIRQMALSELDCFQGRVFDYYIEEDAGRWEKDFPGRGVVLGAKEPGRFRELLLEFKDMPLKKALEFMQYIEYGDLAWRTREQLDADRRLEVLDEEVKMVDPQGKPMYWSGRRMLPLAITREGIEKLWRQSPRDQCFGPCGYLPTILSLVTGEYIFESGFYSVPDRSVRISPETMEKALANPEKYALVFVDCHL
ncbi:MAG: hypothetical protein ACPLQP_00960 [Moorellaceae bacterium]